jgi:hypothetical protein
MKRLRLPFRFSGSCWPFPTEVNKPAARISRPKLAATNRVADRVTARLLFETIGEKTV